MDKEAFFVKEELLAALWRKYQKALESMLCDKGYSEFHDVIETMLGMCPGWSGGISLKFAISSSI